MKPKYYDTAIPGKPEIEIVTALNGRVLDSMPKSARHAAKKAAKKEHKTPVWAKAHRDPEELRHQAHVVSNSRRRGAPTKGADKRRDIQRSLDS